MCGKLFSALDTCDMKRILTLFFLLSLLSLTGCDGLRKLAGRPTSKELEQKL